MPLLSMRSAEFNVALKCCTASASDSYFIDGCARASAKKRARLMALKATRVLKLESEKRILMPIIKQSLKYESNRGYDNTTYLLKAWDAKKLTIRFIFLWCDGM